MRLLCILQVVHFVNLDLDLAILDVAYSQVGVVFELLFSNNILHECCSHDRGVLGRKL